MTNNFGVMQLEKTKPSTLDVGGVSRFREDA